MFPSDLSDLLPPVSDRWWEPLGESYLLICPYAYNFTLQKVETAEAARREHAAKTSPTNAPAPVPRRVTLILPGQPPRSEEVVPMAVDEELGTMVSAAIIGLVLIYIYYSQSRGRQAAPKGATAARKWKLSSAAPLETTKRHVQLR